MTAANELRARAQKIRQLARYAQGHNYRDEIAEAERLENQAQRLDDNVKQQNEGQNYER